MSESNISLRKNPSRAQCEDIIRRILMTEVLEKGTNAHFKSASDFMSYFQSLYPAGDSLTKQVQRAVKALNMPKDEKGYYIINKTEAQIAQDKELAFMLKKTEAKVTSLDQYETVFLPAKKEYLDYLYQLLRESDSLKDKYITMFNTSNGILFYTKNKQQLSILLESLINR